jgi:hypothetical protein
MIAYTRESYWWHTKRYYSLLALNKGTWYRGYLFSEQNKNEKWTYPKVRFEEIDTDSAIRLVSHLDKMGFYKMSRDSLHIIEKNNPDGTVSVKGITDGVNYKFEILYKNELAIIDAYEPEAFLEFLPEIKTRATFIKCRDWFVQKYDKLEPTGEYHLSY